MNILKLMQFLSRDLVADSYQSKKAEAEAEPDPWEKRHSAEVEAAANDRKNEVLYIKAMIAAGWADGHLDIDERRRVRARASGLNPTPSEERLLLVELERPHAVSVLAAQAETDEVRRRVYAVSLATIALDTDAERSYLARLAEALGLSDEVVAELHERYERS